MAVIHKSDNYNLYSIIALVNDQQQNCSEQENREVLWVTIKYAFPI